MVVLVCKVIVLPTGTVVRIGCQTQRIVFGVQCPYSSPTRSTSGVGTPLELVDCEVTFAVNPRMKAG